MGELPGRFEGQNAARLQTSGLPPSLDVLFRPEE
jgi:hypothetical protein